MIGVALKGLLGRKLRTALTALAIVLGVAMISGTYVLTDTITSAYTTIVNDSFVNSDASSSAARLRSRTTTAIPPKRRPFRPPCSRR